MNLKPAFFLSLIFLATPAQLAQAALSEKNFRQDLAYYEKTAQSKNLNANDRLYILNRFREKYRDSGFDLSELYAEIDRWTVNREKGEPPQKTKAEKNLPVKNLRATAPVLKAAGTLKKLLVTENKNFSRLLMESPGTNEYKDMAKGAEDGSGEAAVILYLYNTKEQLKPGSKNFTVKNGMIRQVQAKLVSSNPPTIRVAVSLRKNHPYQIVKNKGQLFLNVEKYPQKEIPETSGSDVPQAALGPTNPETEALTPAESQEEEELMPEGSTVPAPAPELSTATNEPSRRPNSVYILGAVKSPGRYEFQKEMKFMQAVYLAGGFNEKAQLNRVHIVRKENGRKVVQEVHVRALLKKLPQGDLPLKEGDSIVVPEKESSKQKVSGRSVVPWAAFILSLGLVLGLLL